VRHSKTFPWVKLLVMAAVMVVLIMGMTNILMKIDKLRYQSIPTLEVDDWSLWFPTIPKPTRRAPYWNVSESARSPAWYAEHCYYVELDPMDLSPDVPDGEYVNCE